MPKAITEQAIDLASRFRDSVSKLSFSPPAEWTYNPLEYAWEPHKEYLTRYVRPTCRVVFLGMNPGPFGMTQTGVPFGEIAAVRDWLSIETPVGKPLREHPKRPIEGFACRKSEVSGKRLWGLFADRFDSADAFFDSHFVANYCPLVFMDEGGRNVTPDKIAKSEARSLETICDDHLSKLLQLIEPEFAIGVGAYAEACLKRVTNASPKMTVGKILHPSPASPAANKDWAGTATEQLIDAGVWS